MANTREKLIELFRAIAHENCFGSIEKIADHLIANGVTIQQWIPVKERLPEVVSKHNTGRGGLYRFNSCSLCLCES